MGTFFGKKSSYSPRSKKVPAYAITKKKGQYCLIPYYKYVLEHLELHLSVFYL